MLRKRTRLWTNLPSNKIGFGCIQHALVVYRGRRDNALDAASVWRYSARDAFKAPEVPAVDAFRKVIMEAKKQASKP